MSRLYWMRVLQNISWRRNCLKSPMWITQTIKFKATPSQSLCHVSQHRSNPYSNQIQKQKWRQPEKSISVDIMIRLHTLCWMRFFGETSHRAASTPEYRSIYARCGMRSSGTFVCVCSSGRTFITRIEDCLAKSRVVPKDGIPVPWNICCSNSSWVLPKDSCRSFFKIYLWDRREFN